MPIGVEDDASAGGVESWSADPRSRSGRSSARTGRPSRPSPIRGEQSNSSIIFGERAILKLYRVTQAGDQPRPRDRPRPDASAASSRRPRSRARWSTGPTAATAMTAALVSAFVPNQGNLFVHTLDELGGFFERAAAEPRHADGERLDIASLIAAAGETPPDDVHEAIDSYLETARLAGHPDRRAARHAGGCGRAIRRSSRSPSASCTSAPCSSRSARPPGGRSTSWSAAASERSRTARPRTPRWSSSGGARSKRGCGSCSATSSAAGGSGRTATCTPSRSCIPVATSSSSTSRASRPRRSASGA